MPAPYPEGPPELVRIDKPTPHPIDWVRVIRLPSGRLFGEKFFR